MPTNVSMATWMDEMSIPLLTTKLYIPPWRPNLVLRPRLMARLAEALRLRQRLTLVSAKAGSGKTTLVSEWLRQQEQPAAWLSLDTIDNDPRRFFSYLFAALQQLDIVKQNPNVCLELEAGVSLKTGGKACEWGMNFRSVIACGRAERVDEAEARRRALDLIMAHYAPGQFDYGEAALAKIVVLQVKTTSMTGKRSARAL